MTNQVYYQLFNAIRWLTHHQCAYVESPCIPVLRLRHPAADGRADVLVCAVHDPRERLARAAVPILMHESDVTVFADFLECIIAHPKMDLDDIPKEMLPGDHVFRVVTATVLSALGARFDDAMPFNPVHVGLITTEMRAFMKGAPDYRIRGADVFKVLVNVRHAGALFGFKAGELMRFLKAFACVGVADNHPLAHALLVLVNESKDRDRPRRATAACHHAATILRAIVNAGPRSRCRFGDSLLETMANGCANPVMASIVARHFVEHDMRKAAALFGLAFRPNGDACIPLAAEIARACRSDVAETLLREQLKDPRSLKFARFFTIPPLMKVMMSVYGAEAIQALC